MKKVDRKKIDMKVYGDRKESGGRRNTDKKLWGRRKKGLAEEEERSLLSRLQGRPVPMQLHQ